MILITTYLAIFAVGPLAFMALTRPRPSLDRFIWNSLASAGFLIAGALLWHHTGPLALAAALLCLWLGWVVMAAVAVQAVWLRGQRGPVWRMSTALGAVATVIPWFGLSLSIT